MRYSNDPRWITAKFDSICCRCKTKIAKGFDAFYYPKCKSIYCDKETCGKAESANFNAAVFDEEMYYQPDPFNNDY